LCVPSSPLPKSRSSIACGQEIDGAQEATFGPERTTNMSPQRDVPFFIDPASASVLNDPVDGRWRPCKSAGHTSNFGTATAGSKIQAPVVLRTGTTASMPRPRWLRGLSLHAVWLRLCSQRLSCRSCLRTNTAPFGLSSGRCATAAPCALGSRAGLPIDHYGNASQDDRKTIRLMQSKDPYAAS
jgi:hypothetical protein